MQLVMERILYATDLGPRGPEVFRYALSLAEHYGAEIHIVHVVELPRAIRNATYQRFMSEDPLESWREGRQREVIETIQTRLERFCQSAMDADTACRARVADISVLEGPPARTILRRADDIDAHCIVVGSRRYSPLGEMVIGSVARKLTSRSRRPIFLVPV
jgi:nucleotide-binding universal stress UspA family protein